MNVPKIEGGNFKVKILHRISPKGIDKKKTIQIVFDGIGMLFFFGVLLLFQMFLHILIQT